MEVWEVRERKERWRWRRKERWRHEWRSELVWERKRKDVFLRV